MDMHGLVKNSAVFVSMLITQLAFGALPREFDDGWHSWSVSSVTDTDRKCCFSWRGDKPHPKTCDLDDEHGGWSRSGSDLVDNKQNIYVLMKDNQASKIRSFSATCPVSANSVINYHTGVDDDESTRWLSQLISPRTRISSEALSAIAVHQSNRATQVLISVAEKDTSPKNREEAVFWMAQTKAEQTKDTLSNIMFNDQNAKLREHAAFSISQSSLRERGGLLTKLGEEDTSAKVRSQAWFWLAQTKLPNSEKAILSAVETDKSKKVRHQAIFALSQLPEERALNALTTVLEDRSLAMSERKQAIFWLADLGTDDALSYLDKLLE